jgi:hypothetical protein
METMPFAVRTVGLLAVLYAAAVIELAFPAAEFTPSAMALAVTLAANTSRRSVVLWAVLGGLLMDATSSGRLGPFLIAFGLIATVFQTLTTNAPRSWWSVPAMSFALATVQPFVILIVLRLTAAASPNGLDTALMAVTRGGVTAFTATLALLAMMIVQRITSPATTSTPVTLTNRWRMITE